MFAAAQCKATEEVTIDIVRAEVERASRFVPTPKEYLIMTTAVRNARLQTAVRTEVWPFRVHVMFWEDISLELSGHVDLLLKHFPTWTTATVGTSEVRQRVTASTPADYLYNDVTGVFLHHQDVKLRLTLERGEDQERRFDEPWVRRFPDPNASRQIVYIEYDGARVHTAYFVWVDGARYLIPYPKSRNDLRISQAQYHLGSILGYPFRSYGFDEGLRRAGIAVDPALDDSRASG